MPQSKLVTVIFSFTVKRSPIVKYYSSLVSATGLLLFIFAFIFGVVSVVLAATRLTMSQKRKLEIENDLKNNDGRYTFHVPRNVKSIVWNHFQIVKCEDKVENFARCNHCSELLTYSSKGGTGALLRHTCTRLSTSKALRLDRPRAEEKPLQAGRARSPKSRKLWQKVRDEIIKQQLIFITQDLRPPNVMDGDGFKALGQALINVGAEYGRQNIEDVLLPCTTLIRSIIPAKYFASKTQLECDLSLNQLAFAADMWSDVYSQRSFLTLTAHYINDDFELKSSVLGTREFAMGNRSSDNIFGFVMEILNEFGVTEKFNQGVIVTENGADVVEAFKNCKRLPCALHNLSAVVEEVFAIGCSKELKDLIEACRELFCYLEHSELNNILTEPLKKHDRTRCDSLCIMLSSIFSMYNEIQLLLVERNEWHKIAGINLKLLEDLLEFLGPFRDCSEHLSACKYPTIHSYCLWYEKLLKCCAESAKDVEVIASLKLRTRIVLQKHFKLDTYHYIALFLNPPYKKLQFLSEQQRKHIYATVKSLLVDIKKRLKKGAKCVGKFEVVELGDMPSTSKCDAKEDPFDEFKDNYVGCDNCSEKGEVDVEMEKYLQMNVRSCKILDFWWDAVDLPLLRRLAKQILNIPASCTTNQRAFCTPGNILGDGKTKLSSENVDQILFLNRNSECAPDEKLLTPFV